MLIHRYSHRVWHYFSAVIFKIQRTLRSVLGRQLDLSKVKTGLVTWYKIYGKSIYRGFRGFPPSRVSLHVRIHVKDMNKETFT